MRRRSYGVQVGVFRAERLSNVREKLFATYKVNVVRDTFVAERTRTRTWLSFAPSSLE